MSNALTSFETIAASSFVGDLGTDTHIPYTDGEYSSTSLIISDLSYLGINNIRDGITNGQNGSAPISSYISLALAGVKFTFVMEGATDAALLARLQLVDEVAAAVPGSVIAVEGPNEINNQPFTFDGTAGLQGALHMQAEIYAYVTSDPTLAGVAVDYFTGYGASSFAVGPDPVATSLATYDNQHPYPNYNESPAFWVSRSQALSNTSSPTEPAVYTETGYSTNNVNTDVQAVYTLDLLMDTAQQGISKTYLYDLLDAYAPGSVQGDDGFGLFSYTETQKPAAIAIHNLTTILQDTLVASPTLNSLAYSITDLPSDGNSILLQEPDGSNIISVWAEPEIWNNATSSEITAPVENVTISLDGTYSSVEIFDPLLGTGAIASYASVNSVTIAISDHPVLVDVSGDLSAGAPCFAAGTPILTTRGEIAVEQLNIGDVLITHAGEDAPITWIGRRRLDLAAHPHPLQAQPVRIARDAFGPGMPERDVILSPDHALYVSQHLIPVKALINGGNIVQLRRQSVTYYHIELLVHAVIFAANLAVESYLETGNRGAFDNGGNLRSMDFAAAQLLRSQGACAPLVEKGPVVAAVKRQLLQNFLYGAVGPSPRIAIHF